MIYYNLDEKKQIRAFQLYDFNRNIEQFINFSHILTKFSQRNKMFFCSINLKNKKSKFFLSSLSNTSIHFSKKYKILFLNQSHKCVLQCLSLNSFKCFLKYQFKKYFSYKCMSVSKSEKYLFFQKKCHYIDIRYISNLKIIYKTIKFSDFIFKIQKKLKSQFYAYPGIHVKEELICCFSNDFHSKKPILEFKKI